MTETILTLLEREIAIADDLLKVENQKSRSIISANIQALMKQIQESQRLAIHLADLQKKRVRFVNKNLTIDNNTNDSSDLSLAEIVKALGAQMKNSNNRKNKSKVLIDLDHRYRDTIHRLGSQISYNQRILKRSHEVIRNLLTNIKQQHTDADRDKLYDKKSKSKNTVNSLLLEAKA